VSAWVEEAMHAGEASGAARGLHTTQPMMSDE